MAINPPTPALHLRLPIKFLRHLTTGRRINRRRPTKANLSIRDMILLFTAEVGFRPNPTARPLTRIIRILRISIITLSNSSSRILRYKMIQSDSLRLIGIPLRLLLEVRDSHHRRHIVNRHVRRPWEEEGEVRRHIGPVQHHP